MRQDQATTFPLLLVARGAPTAVLAAVTVFVLVSAAVTPARAQTNEFWASQFGEQSTPRAQPRRERERERERSAVMKPSSSPSGPDAASVAERTQQRKSNLFVADFGTVAKMIRTEPMASGEPLIPGEIIAAHATLPIGSSVLVSDVATGRSLVIRVKDRTVSLKAAVELSAGALAALGLKEKELDKARVRLVPVWVPTGEPLFWPRVMARESAGAGAGVKDVALTDAVAKDARGVARTVAQPVRE